MKQYRRVVSYVYRYEKGEKGENTGFIRIDTREDGIRFHCRMKDLRMHNERKLKMYFYFHIENRLQLIFVDEVLCSRGNCEYKKLIFPDLSDGDFEKINGVLFLDGQDLIYGSCWDEREISEKMLTEEAEEEKGAEETKEEEIGFEEEEEKMLGKTEKSILADFPRINLPESENRIYAVKIKLEDLPILPSSEWKLADNVFLKQAYENFDHLFLGKIMMQDGQSVWVLGVPGIYSNKEKYLAGIFGFSHYIPEETKEFKTGGRGYWFRHIPDME